MRAGEKKRCEVCGAAFGPLSSRKRFCSQKCHDRYYAAKRRPKATCEQCGRRFQPLENTPVRFCVACAIQRKAARVGIDPRKVHVGVARPPCTTKEAVGL